MEDHELLSLGPIGAQPQVDLLLAATRDSRDRTLRELATVTDPMVSWRPPMSLDSIGEVLYHVALIEADWLLNDVLGWPEAQWPSWVADEFPIDVRDADGGLSRVPDETLGRSLVRMDRVRALLLEQLLLMSDADLHRPRRLPDYEVTPAWALHHLLQHEAEHRAHVALVRNLYLVSSA